MHFTQLSQGIEEGGEEREGSDKGRRGGREVRGSRDSVHAPFHKF